MWGRRVQAQARASTKALNTAGGAGRGQRHVGNCGVERAQQEAPFSKLYALFFLYFFLVFVPLFPCLIALTGTSSTVLYRVVKTDFLTLLLPDQGGKHLVVHNLE